jgi:hypothetical protein
MLARLGWWLMGLPAGIHRPWSFLLRWGPYRWGAWLMKRDVRNGEPVCETCDGGGSICVGFGDTSHMRPGLKRCPDCEGPVS